MGKWNNINESEKERKFSGKIASGSLCRICQFLVCVCVFLFSYLKLSHTPNKGSEIEYLYLFPQTIWIKCIEER
jgi:hypothetical protein